MSARDSSMAPVTTQTILVLDDEALVLRTLQRVLENMGCHALLASTSRQAMELVRTATPRPRVAILDATIDPARLPELASQLREAEPAIRILLTSGYPRDDLEQELAASAADGFLQKPFLPHSLEATIRNLLPLPTR